MVVKSKKYGQVDIVGGLTGENGIAGTEIGKISVFDNSSYVAVALPVMKTAINKIRDGKLKGRNFRVRAIT